MRKSEWINVIYFSFFIAFVWLRPYSTRQRWIVTFIGIAGIAVVFLVMLSSRILPPLSANILRDWMPVGLMVLAYRQPGVLFQSQNTRLQGWLQTVDRKILSRVGLLDARSDRSLIAVFYQFTELAYLLCYPLVPFGLALLYAAGMREHADEFWTTVLSASYLCYALVPLTQTLPPRSLPNGEASAVRWSQLRILNLWILRHASIQVNTFPSAHVAASLAIALAVLRFLPTAGLVLLALAISIAIGAAAGRYHYFVDVMAGAALAILVFLIRAL